MKTSHFLPGLAACLFLLLANLSCNKDDLSGYKDGIEDPLMRLSTVVQKNFFDRGYIHRVNTRLREPLTSRSPEEYIDSVFHYLLALELERPYVHNLVSYIGYPVWTGAIAHPLVEEPHHTVTIPFTGAADSLVLGHLTCVYTGETWKCRILARDGLYTAIADTALHTILHNDPNTMSYLSMITFYDYLLFAYYDSILHVFKYDFEQGIGPDNLPVLPRCGTIVTQTCEWCEGAFQAEKQLELRGWLCNCKAYMEATDDCSQFIGTGSHLEGMGGGWIGNPDGNTAGGSGSGSYNGNGSRLGQCGYTLVLLPYLCIYGYDLSIYGEQFIIYYNSIVKYLMQPFGNWLLQHGTTAILAMYSQFIHGFSLDKPLNGVLANLYFLYTPKDHATEPMSLEDFGHLLFPYVAEMGTWQLAWFGANITIVDHPDIEKFLAFLTQVVAQLNDIGNLSWAYTFTESHDFSDESIEFALDVFDLIDEDPEIMAVRCGELYDLLLDDPDALLEECLNGNPGINPQDYVHLFNFEIPQSCKDRLNELGTGWSWQPIEQGNVKKTNLDYFPVTIIQRPDFNGNGIPDSDAEIFHAIRMEFLTLADGSVQNFVSSCAPFPWGQAHWDFKFYDEVDPAYIGPDRAIWPTNDPVSTIFFIEASATNGPLSGLDADHGAVIVSDYCPSNCWVFSTIETPESESQPFSGNRQWGLTTVNGQLTFYTRAVDRVHLVGVMNTVLYRGCATKDYYKIGAHTWKNLQEKVRQFVVNHGGQAVVDPNARFAINPDWKELYELLIRDEAIESIPCLSH